MHIITQYIYSTFSNVECEWMCMWIWMFDVSGLLVVDERGCKK